MRFGRVWMGVCFAGVLLVSAAGLSQRPVAQENGDSAKKHVPDPDAGRALAVRLCSNCHLVPEGADTKIVPADTLSFRAIAGKPGQTTDNIINKLLVPHTPMPAISLTRNEITDIVAFIVSLEPDILVVPPARDRKYPGPKTKPKA